MPVTILDGGCSGGGGGDTGYPLDGGNSDLPPGGGGGNDMITIGFVPNDGLVPIGQNPDCDAVKTQLNNPKYNHEIKSKLQTNVNFNKDKETGITEHIANTGLKYYINTVPRGNTHSGIPDEVNILGYNHVHQRDYYSGFNNRIVNKTTQLPSHADVYHFIKLCLRVQQNPTPYINTSTIYSNIYVYRETANEPQGPAIYSFRYNEMVPTIAIPPEDLEKYTDLVNLTSEVGFLKYIKNHMGISSDSFKLFKTDVNGITSELKLDENNNLIKTKCN